jgi:hypothetical protein
MFKFMQRRAFKKEFKQAAKDGVLTQSEISELQKHNVDQQFANDVRTKHYLKETESLRNEIMKTRRMSPNQEAQLFAIADGLQLEPNLDENYRKFRELWAAENGEEVFLEPVQAPVMLKPGEQCCFSAPAIWAQLKSVKTRVGYSGFSTSFRIAKGVSYRIGTVKPQYNVTEEMKQLSGGTLYITNKRLFLDGDGQSTTITFNRILNVEPIGEGLEVSKTSGQNDFFQMTTLNAEYAFLVIQEFNRSS